jgi:hypothetical protein
MNKRAVLIWRILGYTACEIVFGGGAGIFHQQTTIANSRWVSHPYQLGVLLSQILVIFRLLAYLSLYSHECIPPPEEQEDGRTTKRRKLGIAETLISTVVSIAIVSTAVGYTAYKL